MNSESAPQAAEESTSQASPQTETPSLLDSIIDQSKLVRAKDKKTEQAKEERKHARDIIGELVKEVMAGTVTVKKDLIKDIDQRIAKLDELLSEQLNAVMHESEFQTLEASWRGLHYLVRESETSPSLKIKVLNADKADLLSDFESASEFDQSALFKKVYEEEYGTYGGAPFAALVGDYDFDYGPQDMSLLGHISHVAGAAHAPFIAAASPGLFKKDNFSEVFSSVRDLSCALDPKDGDYVKWNSFRETEDSRYVGLTLPRVLGRLPYGKETVPVKAFNFTEDSSSHEHYLWTNAAYAMGARLTDAFARHGWCAAIRGPEGGGKVEDLPAHVFNTDEGESALKCPTEIAISDRREYELANLGLIPLLHCKGTDHAAFFSAQTAQKPKKYDTDAANANAALSARLQYIMVVSRVAHYLKCMMRDHIGKFASRQDVEDYLNRWIEQYVSLDDTAGDEVKRKFPFREAKIEVVSIPGKPGAYKAVAFLRPHYQLEELTISLRLVADLPESKG